MGLIPQEKELLLLWLCSRILQKSTLQLIVALRKGTTSFFVFLMKKNKLLSSVSPLGQNLEFLFNLSAGSYVSYCLTHTGAVLKAYEPQGHCRGFQLMVEGSGNLFPTTVKYVNTIFFNISHRKGVKKLWQNQHRSGPFNWQSQNST